MKSAENRGAGASPPLESGARGERFRALGAKLLLAVGALALCARVPLVLTSIGSNDMPTWQSFGSQIAATSVGHLYDTHPLFNHPPLMGLFASLTYSLSRWTGAPFEWLFKAPMLLADAASACLLYWSWRRRNPLTAALVFAAFCCNPVSFQISSYHGNTDSLCASLLLACALLLDLQLFFAAGLALAASINVKLLPVVLILPMLGCAGGRKSAARFVGGLSLGVIPFLPYLLWHWQGFYEHALAYRSYANSWGIGLIGSKLSTTPHLRKFGVRLAVLWVEWGARVVLLGPALLGLAQHFRRHPVSAREVAAASMLAFVVLTPGWGIQYLVYPAALLFAVSLSGGVWYSLAAGAYAYVTYASLWRGGRPYFSDFSYGENLTGQFIGGIAWVMATRVLYDVLRLGGVHPLPGAGLTQPLSETRVGARVRAWLGSQV